MINLVYVVRDSLNKFTTFVKDNFGVVVRLRNGDIVRPTFHLAGD